MEALRTPDERFEGLPGYPWEPDFREWEGLRLAHLDLGPPEAAPVLLVHGEPTWSYLWRKVLAPLLDGGHRCVVPDLPGFGRSDKPAELGWYTYDRHVAAVSALAEALDLRGATMVVHDWGGPVGLRVATELPERFDRLVVLDSGIFTGRQRMSEPWHAFRDFVERTEDLPVGFLVRGGCARDPGDAVVAAYEAPFPAPEFKAGARAFPLILPIRPDMAGAEAGQRTLEALARDPRPKLVLWAAEDRILDRRTGERFAAALGTEVAHWIEGAGHFLQEDAGEEIGRRIAGWLAA